MSKTEHVGALPKRLSLSASDILRILWLMGIGLTIVLLNTYIKIPIQIPGHRIEWVALVVIARLSSPYPWAATLSSGTAASTMAVMNLGNPIESGIFLAVGVVFDVLYWLTRKPKNIIVIALIAAAAYMSKPVIMIGADLMAGFPYRPLLISAWFPMSTYFVFGFIGGLIGVVLIDIDKKLVKTLRRSKKGS